MRLEEIVIKLIEAHPYLTLVYIFIGGVGASIGVYVSKKYLKSGIDEETKRKLEEIYFEVKTVKEDGRDISSVLQDVRIKLEIILEKLRGKDL